MKVVFDAAAHLVFGRCFAAEAVYLRPAGDAGLDVVTTGIELDRTVVELIVNQRVRTRSDERHVAAQHVQKLRQFVDVQFADDAADARDAIVVRGRLFDVAVVLHRLHRAELADAERLLVEAIATLEEQRRTARFELDGDCGREQQRAQQNERDRGERDVDRALQHHFHQGQRATDQAERGDRAIAFERNVGEAFQNALRAEMDRGGYPHEGVDARIDGRLV